LNDITQGAATQDKINKLSWFYWRRVKKPRICRCQPHANKKRQTPYNKIKIASVFCFVKSQHMGFWKPKNSSIVWPLTNMPAHNFQLPLRTRIDPILKNIRIINNRIHNAFMITFCLNGEYFICPVKKIWIISEFCRNIAD